MTPLVTAAKYGAAMLKKTPAILMVLYEIDLLEEEEELKWAAKSPGPKDDAGRQARAAAAPFITWLQEAEEDHLAVEDSAVAVAIEADSEVDHPVEVAPEAEVAQEVAVHQEEEEVLEQVPKFS